MSEYRKVPEMSEPGVDTEKEPSSEVTVHFLRHEDKEKNPPEGGTEKDIELTMEGRRKALEMSIKKQPGIGIAVGSERVRAQHTALLRLEGFKGQLTPEMDFAEAKKVVDAELKVGSRVAVHPELTFAYDGSPEYSQQFLAEYKVGHGLEFLLHKSDDVVRQVKDTKSLSYSRTAANISSLLARELHVSRGFHQVVKHDPEKFAPLGNRIERYFGTHQTVPESFYMKVLEKTQGREAAEEFIDKFRDKDGKANGFDFQEGFTVHITSSSQGQRLTIEGPRDFPSIELTSQLLREIIEDAQRLDQDIEQVMKAEGEQTEAA